MLEVDTRSGCKGFSDAGPNQDLGKAARGRPSVGGRQSSFPPEGGRPARGAGGAPLAIPQLRSDGETHLAARRRAGLQIPRHTSHTDQYLPWF